MNCCHADHEQVTTARVRPDLDQSAVRTSLQELRQQNKDRAARGKYEPWRQIAEKSPPILLHAPTALALPDDGLPLAGFGAAASLRPTGRIGLGFAVFSSQLLLIGSFALFFLSYLPRLFWWLPSLWPEQLLLIGSVGTLLLGFSLLGACCWPPRFWAVPSGRGFGFGA